MTSSSTSTGSQQTDLQESVVTPASTGGDVQQQHKPLWLPVIAADGHLRNELAPPTHWSATPQWKPRCGCQADDGRMFWLTRKRLSGSYFDFIDARRE